MTDVPGTHLRRTAAHDEEIDALAEQHGGRAGLDGVVADLDRQARRSRLGRVLGRAVREACTWERRDAVDRRWWPQGITTSADASDSERVAGRRLVVVSWYAKRVDGVGHGSRISVLDLDTLRYRHVLLVTPAPGADGAPGWRPLEIHAGGLAWRGPHLHVAATGRGLVTFRPEDLLRVDRPAAAFGHGYVLPARYAYRAGAGVGSRFRFSFVSVDTTTRPPGLLAGEYGRGDASTRLARFDLDEDTGLLATGTDGVSQATGLADAGLVQMQGAVEVRGRHHVTTSHGPWVPGSVHVGAPGDFTRRRFAVPMGPEDLAYWPSTDRLWSVTEHPGRRWVVALDRAQLCLGPFASRRARS